MKRSQFFLLLTVIVLISCKEEKRIMTVTGWQGASQAGITLPHEHVLVDFIGADSISPGRYRADSAFQKALPYLLELKKAGCQTLMECTPAYLGRDAALLARLSHASGLNLVTNTGYYGAAQQKFLPKHVFTETAEQLADRWTREFENGIDDTGIKPGFMKLGADTGPLTDAQKKIMKAGALTHLRTGLTIAVHTGDGNAAREELEIFASHGVLPSAFVWVHAQNESNPEVHKELAEKGVWVEFDDVHPESIEQHVGFLKFMKEHKLLHRTLLSHDAGWYHVGEPGGGDYRGYITLFQELLPRLRQEGFSEEEIDQVLHKNPAEAFAVHIRKK
ncbi:MAG: phosphotriesterase [Cyclobacteriaceae bacterium]|nr:phosphotriesterase [Cyclobacteriaceae bacterium]